MSTARRLSVSLALGLTIANRAHAESAPLTSTAPAAPIVVYVVVPLCSNEQINCGSPIAGRSAGLEHNVYWGAIFGARRFLERSDEPRGRARPSRCQPKPLKSSW